MRKTSLIIKFVFGMGLLASLSNAQFPNTSHPGWDIISFRPDNFEPMVTGMAFRPNGDLVVCHWGGLHALVHQRQMNGKIYLLKNVTGNSPKPTVLTLAEGLEDPVGLTIVDNKIYVSGGNTLSEFVDANNDGVLDSRIKTIFTLEGTHARHEFLFGLLYQNGKFYLNPSSAKLNNSGLPGDAQSNRFRGTMLEVDPTTGKHTVLAMGFREPNGIGIGPEGEKFVPDVQGNWLPASKLIHVKKGRFYGFKHTPAESYDEMKESPPVVWVPQNDVANAMGNPLYLDTGLYAGQFLMGEVFKGGIRRFYVEKVDGEYQGAVFNFGNGIEAGVERMIIGPDGMIYLGLCGQGNGWSFNKDFGLQKMKPNGKPVFEMLAVRSRPKGMEIEFTEEIGDAGTKLSAYSGGTWFYKPTAGYGGEPQEYKALSFKSILVSKDKKKVYLEIDNLKTGNVVNLKMNFSSAAGRAIWTKDAWYTLNAFGKGEPFDPTTSSNWEKGIQEKKWAADTRIRVAAGALAIHLANTQPHSVLVFNMNGEKIGSMDVSGKQDYSLSTKGWKPGVCLVETRSEGQVTRQKIALP